MTSQGSTPAASSRPPGRPVREEPPGGNAPSPPAPPPPRTPARAASQDGAAVRAALEEEAGLFPSGPENLSPRDGGRIFARPFLGFAAGDDPAWFLVREAVGEGSWIPEEAFARGGAGPGARPAVPAPDLTVLAAVLPQTPETVARQGEATAMPADPWVASKYFHDRAVNGLMLRLAGRLAALGIEAVVPELAEGYGTFPHERWRITSSWSHRHAAWAAGLGTFGLCDGLITRAGKAHRLGSLVFRAAVPASPRPYAGFRDWCLHYAPVPGGCGRCIGRCPAGALSPAGHDKALCRDFLYGTRGWAQGRFPDLPGADACGLCQAAVPCATRAPAGRP
ncbi:MAG: 4Fe-4S ferredoxin [Deltaproteobacteria bacterium]|nr:4Fe-4S ferredoxin [Deltaproteobacteria bacterium]